MAKEYWTPGAGWRTGSGFEMFDRLGHPGKYTDCMKLASSTTTTFTGSLYGYGAFLIENATNVEFTSSNGVGIPGASFNTKEIVDIAPRRIKIGGTGVVYVFRTKG